MIPGLSLGVSLLILWAQVVDSEGLRGELALTLTPGQQVSRVQIHASSC